MLTSSQSVNFNIVTFSHSHSRGLWISEFSWGVLYKTNTVFLTLRSKKFTVAAKKVFIRFVDITSHSSYQYCTTYLYLPVCRTKNCTIYRGTVLFSTMYRIPYHILYTLVPRFYTFLKKGLYIIPFFIHCIWIHTLEKMSRGWLKATRYIILKFVVNYTCTFLHWAKEHFLYYTCFLHCNTLVKINTWKKPDKSCWKTHLVIKHNTMYGSHVKFRPTKQKES